MVNAPELSFRGAKRRGNLAVPSPITGQPRRNRNCLPEIAAAPSGPRNDKFESLMPPNYRPNTCSCQWRSGNALQTQSACTFLSLPCTSCKCLTPHFTRILRPGGGKNAALSGETPIFRMFCGQNGVQWAESLQKNNIAGKTDKRARNFSEQLKFLCNVV